MWSPAAVPAGDTLVSIVEHILGEFTLKTKRRRGDRERFLVALGMSLQVRALHSGGMLTPDRIQPVDGALPAGMPRASRGLCLTRLCPPTWPKVHLPKAVPGAGELTPLWGEGRQAQP